MSLCLSCKIAVKYWWNFLSVPFHKSWHISAGLLGGISWCSATTATQPTNFWWKRSGKTPIRVQQKLIMWHIDDWWYILIDGSYWWYMLYWLFRLRDCTNVLRAGGCHQGFDDWGLRINIFLWWRFFLGNFSENVIVLIHFDQITKWRPPNIKHRWKAVDLPLATVKPKNIVLIL